MMEFLFLDLDDTILDFHKAEAVALSKTIRQFGLEPTQEVLDRYHVINKWHWEQLELGTLTREEVLVNRFGQLFREFSVDVEPTACARAYEKNLSQGHWFLPGAEEAVKRLHEKYRLFLASNGTATVQHGRLTSANLYPWFEKVFVSQDIGYNKPSTAYFEACFAQIPGFDKRKAMMVGDSLTSDIRGGRDAGITTVWVNAEGKTAPAELQPDYEIKALSELEALLESIEG